MTTVFYSWLYGRFAEIQSNLRRKKLHRMNQGSNSFGGSFNSRDILRAPIQIIYVFVSRQTPAAANSIMLY